MVQGLFHYIFIKIPRWFSSLVSIQVTSRASYRRADYQLHFAPPSSRKCVKAPLGCAVAGWLLAANPWCRKACPCSPPYRTPPRFIVAAQPIQPTRAPLGSPEAAPGCGAESEPRRGAAAGKPLSSPTPGATVAPRPRPDGTSPHSAARPPGFLGKKAFVPARHPAHVQSGPLAPRTALGREAIRTGVAARARRAGSCGDQGQDGPQLGRGSASRRKGVHAVPLLPHL